MLERVYYDGECRLTTARSLNQPKFPRSFCRRQFYSVSAVSLCRSPIEKSFVIGVVAAGRKSGRPSEREKESKALLPTTPEVSRFLRTVCQDKVGREPNGKREPIRTHIKTVPRSKTKVVHCFLMDSPCRPPRPRTIRTRTTPSINAARGGKPEG